MVLCFHITHIFLTKGQYVPMESWCLLALINPQLIARREHQIPWSWCYKGLYATQSRYWEPDPGPLQEQQLVLKAEPFLLFHIFLSIKEFFWISLFYCNSSCFMYKNHLLSLASIIYSYLSYNNLYFYYIKTNNSDL